MALQQKSKQQIRKFRRERRRVEETEIEELERRVQEEAPPKGWTPLAEDYDSQKNKKKAAKGSDESEESDDESQEEQQQQQQPVDEAGNPLTVKFSKATFSELPISRRTLEGLSNFGYKNMTDIQRAALPHALAGRDVLGAAKTGSGKTLAFLIPIIEKLYRLKWSREDGLGALIISPTRELAMQTFEVLRKVGSRHDSLSAGLVIGGKDMKLEQERIGRMNILVSTPGRLLQHMDQTVDFQTHNLKILVLDEADRILDMGFKKEVDAIVENLPPARQTLLFSATQTSSVQQLARLSLTDPEYLAVHEASATSTPKKLQQSYIELEAQQKIDVLWSFLKSHLKQKTLVFVSSQKQVRFLFEAFRRLRPGVALMHIHGKMNQQKRMAMYLDFVGKDAAVLIATDIAARGLDFKGIDWVIQMDAPENVDTYIHRVGRTARYHSEGHAILFLCPSEMQFLERLEKRKIPIERMKVNPSKTQTIQQSLQAALIKEPELKYLAQRALRSYLRSIHIMNDKEVFDVTKINTEELAYSHGLMQIPNLKFGNVKKVDKNAEIFKSKVETMQRRMDEAEQAKKEKKKQQKERLKKLSASAESQDDSDSDEDEDDERIGSNSSGEEDGDDAAVGSKDSDDDEMILQIKKPKQRKTKLEKLMNKKNSTVLSDAFAKMRGKTEDDDDVLVLKKKHSPDDMDVDGDDAAADSAPIEPTLTKSKLKKMFTKIDPNKPRFGKLEEFGSDDDDDDAKKKKQKGDEPFIDAAVQSLKDRDAGDQAAYKEKLREKNRKKKEKKKAEEEAKRAKKNQFNAMLSGGMGGAILGSPEDDGNSGSGSDSDSSDSDSSSSSSHEAPKKKQQEEIRRGKRKRPDESSSESNSDDDDSDDDKANFATKRMKLEDQAKKILSKRLGK